MAGHLSAADLAAIAISAGLWIPIMLLFAGIMIATTPLVADFRAQKPLRKSQPLHASPYEFAILGVVAAC
ncbi:MAG: MATE family efflux transporter [Acinetobacter sp.]